MTATARTASQTENPASAGFFVGRKEQRRTDWPVDEMDLKPGLASSTE